MVVPICMRKCFARSSLVLFLYIAFYSAHICAAGINPPKREETKKKKYGIPIRLGFASIFVRFVCFWEKKFHRHSKTNTNVNVIHLMRTTINLEFLGIANISNIWSYILSSASSSTSVYMPGRFILSACIILMILHTIHVDDRQSVCLEMLHSSGSLLLSFTNYFGALGQKTKLVKRRRRCSLVGVFFFSARSLVAYIHNCWSGMYA